MKYLKAKKQQQEQIEKKSKVELSLKEKIEANIEQLEAGYRISSSNIRKLIDLYNERGKQIGMKRFRHNQYWASSLQKYFEEPKVKEQKEVNKENKDRDDD